jgi:TIR domain
MDRVEIVSSWTWTPDSIRCSITSITGGMIPIEVKPQLMNLTLKINVDNNCWLSGNNICKYLHNTLPEPTPLDLGTENIIRGVAGEVSVIKPDVNKVKMLYWIKYSNGHKQRVWHEWEIPSLPEAIQAMLNAIAVEANNKMREYFLETYGNGQVNPEKWKANKIKVFVSYRSNCRKLCKEVVDGLGEYGNHSIFLPQVDFLDMQAGNWMDQLMKMIADCSVFIPILTKEYLDGPISKPELDAALRKHFSAHNTKIIPLLIDGTPGDYTAHFIGGFHMVQAQSAINKDTIDELAHLALGASKNPYL